MVIEAAILLFWCGIALLGGLAGLAFVLGLRGV